MLLPPLGKVVLAVALAGAVTVSVPGSAPPAPERAESPSGFSADGSAQWTAEPSAATLANAAAPRRAEQFYFVLPDRFANGDTRNDTGGLGGDRLTTGLDPADKGFYHGGDLKGVAEHLDYIQN